MIVFIVLLKQKRCDVTDEGLCAMVAEFHAT